MRRRSHILLIGTGGTIASDVTEGGLAPELTTEELLSHIPAISQKKNLFLRYQLHQFRSDCQTAHNMACACHFISVCANKKHLSSPKIH